MADTFASPTTATGRRSFVPAPFARLGQYLRRAVHAGAFPLRGIVYFGRHRELYPLFFGRLLPLCAISFLVYFVLFAFTFLPQFAFLALFHGWGAWLNAVVLVLGEGLVITQGLFEGFFVDACRVDVFDATLIDRGCADLVAPHRLLFPDAPNAVKMLGAPTSPAAYQPWSLVQIVELAVCLPLNLVPYVGTPAFLLITGARLGTLSQYRWYQLRGLTRRARKAEIRTRSWEYTWFGTVAMVLELVPVLAFFFLLTSTAGSALWAAELETTRRQPVAAVAAASPTPTGSAATQESIVADARRGIDPEVDYEDDPV
ncbi:hypothetical protein SPI_05967 [Niveomyces insectorum RCEF 264]|uniref:Uncharacterized protein n=1 Tax=Niveomyces insectorum RCEF 264 TaxID=1081102 RepID=A0A167SMY4_9HYPO|nr:hypothetical protein SPI_05967 [Niveomyces insectorum RCEF 264]